MTVAEDSHRRPASRYAAGAAVTRQTRPKAIRQPPKMARISSLPFGDVGWRSVTRMKNAGRMRPMRPRTMEARLPSSGRMESNVLMRFPRQRRALRSSAA